MGLAVSYFIIEDEEKPKPITYSERMMKKKDSPKKKKDSPKKKKSIPIKKRKNYF